MAAGASATITANQRASRVARVGDPKIVKATTNNSELRLRGDLLGGFDQVTVGRFGGIGPGLRRRGLKK